jgi:5-formyltetrahydrofolate cyclo-ligase
MESKELRAKYKALRSQLSENDIETMSFITNLLLTLPIWEKTYFTFFYPLQNKKEDTELILHLLSGKTKADFDSRQMTHFLLTDNTKIKKKHNIPEPVDGIEVPIKLKLYLYHY